MNYQCVHSENSAMCNPCAVYVHPLGAASLQAHRNLIAGRLVGVGEVDLAGGRTKMSQGIMRVLLKCKNFFVSGPAPWAQAGIFPGVECFHEPASCESSAVRR